MWFTEHKQGIGNHFFISINILHATVTIFSLTLFYFQIPRLCLPPWQKHMALVQNLLHRRIDCWIHSTSSGSNELLSTSISIFLSFPAATEILFKPSRRVLRLFHVLHHLVHFDISIRREAPEKRRIERRNCWEERGRSEEIGGGVEEDKLTIGRETKLGLFIIIGYCFERVQWNKYLSYLDILFSKKEI